MNADFKIEERKINIAEYQHLRATTGWAMFPDEIVESALKNDLYSVSVLCGNEAAGIGRVIGDGGIYFYIQDVIVAPKYQGLGLGDVIMQHIEKYIFAHANNNSFIGLMAAQGVSKFYEKYGYKKRGAEQPGMFKRMVY